MVNKGGVGFLNSGFQKNLKIKNKKIKKVLNLIKDGRVGGGYVSYFQNF